MNTIRTTISCAILLLPMAMHGHGADGCFFTISETSPAASASVTTHGDIGQATSLALEGEADLFEALVAPRSSVIEELLRPFRQSLNKGKSIAYSPQVISYYDGESHPLTLNNVLEVMKEVGLSNRLIVLAQAVLETGHFTSKVCKQYNNLFGLYDSRHHDYYRFERWEDSVVAYQKFIQYRYKGGNYFQFLKRIGYAQDRQYIPKVAKIAKQLYNRLLEGEIR